MNRAVLGEMTALISFSAGLRIFLAYIGMGLEKG
jgi:hypothetical protein